MALSTGGSGLSCLSGGGGGGVRNREAHRSLNIFVRGMPIRNRSVPGTTTPVRRLFFSFSGLRGVGGVLRSEQCDISRKRR